MYSEANYSNGVMIALIPMAADWSTLARPHLTLVYAGSVSQHDPSSYNELGKDAMDLGISFGPQTLESLGIETLGMGSEMCDVVTFKPTPELLAMRRAVEHWNASEWPWKPHVTIGPVGTPINDVPEKVTFDSLYTAWGNQGMYTRLNP